MGRGAGTAVPCPYNGRSFQAAAARCNFGGTCYLGQTPAVKLRMVLK